MGVITGLRKAWGRKRLIFLVYSIQFALALTIGLQVYHVFEASIGNSLSLEGLKSGYAHTVINDLLNIHGSSLSPLFGHVRWMLILYLLISVFLSAGIWFKITRERDANFWIGASSYFLRFLVVSILFAISFVLLSALMWGPYLSKIQYWMEYWSSEEWILWLGIIIAIGWFLIAAYLFICSCFTKMSLVLDERSMIKSLGYGFYRGTRKYMSLLPGLLLFAVLIVFFYAISACINEMSLASSAMGIFLTFLLQQCVIWLKIWLRIGSYEYLKASS